MLSSYVKGACAIYVYQGVWYAVENFALEESENSGGTLSCNAYGPEAEAALNEYIECACGGRAVSVKILRNQAL